MSDIVERLRGLRFVHVPVASQLMDEAAREIERLRLTDAEREAVEIAIRWLEPYPQVADTLRKLLARLA
jgi:hypothetical protein